MIRAKDELDLLVGAVVRRVALDDVRTISTACVPRAGEPDRQHGNRKVMVCVDRIVRIGLGGT